ncbi:tRNA uracil 4-sulfurtransferase ThiI [Bacillus fonticola]|uniref:tRNA uracil 4-sulfurtransferase ThiI n=1 Tax=Bacillus fonticola TaxID=2728853 RepID=UPI0014746D4E|nr:tRNA uracil 4-sulfurtransferase ThiI [Bacillus fonticola]
MYDHVLIRYGDLSTKGRNRSAFVSRLKRQIRSVLSQWPELDIISNRDRTFIHLHGVDFEQLRNPLENIFGIISFSPVVKVNRDMEEISLAASQLLEKEITKPVTFKVSTRRADKQFPLNTNEMNYFLGSHLLKTFENLSVNVHEPDLELTVEIRKEAIYLSYETVAGAGGFPVGSSGKAMSMLSGGLDSPVSTFLAMRRGIEVEAIHFHSPPYTSDRAKQKVEDIGQLFADLTGEFTVHYVPFAKVQELIQKQIPENYTMTSTRRMMLKLTDAIRSTREGKAIITGESIGQVASQTLDSMIAINAVTATPILRPLATLDKQEIVTISKRIGAYDISIRPYEDCCTIFTPPNPKTRPKLEKVERYESFVDFDNLLLDVLQHVETVTYRANQSVSQEMSQLL